MKTDQELRKIYELLNTPSPEALAAAGLTSEELERLVAITTRDSDESVKRLEEDFKPKILAKYGSESAKKRRS